MIILIIIYIISIIGAILSIRYDVGVDNNNFTPVNLAELLDKIHYKAHIK